MSHRIIRSLFESRLATWASATVPVLRIAFEGVSFTPQDDETYLRTYTLPAGTNSNTLAGDHHLYTGVFQISVVTPSGEGSGRAGALVDELADLFPVNLRLQSGSFEVVVMTPVDPGPGISEGTTYTVAASFQYRADTE